MLPSARIWISAVWPFPDAARHVGRDLDAQVHLALKEQLFEVSGVFGVVGDTEGLVAGDSFDEVPAFVRAGLVHHGHLDVLDVVIHHVAEYKDLDDGRHNEHAPVLLIPEQDDEFLAHKLPDPHPAHRPSFLSSLTFNVARTMNMNESTAKSLQSSINPRSFR